MAHKQGQQQARSATQQQQQGQRTVNVAAARKKLNELFITWVTIPETQDLLKSLIRQHAATADPITASSNNSTSPPPVITMFTDEDLTSMVQSSLATIKEGGVAVKPIGKLPVSHDFLSADSGSMSPPRSPKSPRMSPHHPPASPQQQQQAVAASKFKHVDELDQFRTKVASPPSSPKPTGAGTANSRSATTVPNASTLLQPPEGSHVMGRPMSPSGRPMSPSATRPLSPGPRKTPTTAAGSDAASTSVFAPGVLGTTATSSGSGGISPSATSLSPAASIASSSSSPASGGTSGGVGSGVLGSPTRSSHHAHLAQTQAPSAAVAAALLSSSLVATTDGKHGGHHHGGHHHHGTATAAAAHPLSPVSRNISTAPPGDRPQAAIVIPERPATAALVPQFWFPSGQAVNQQDLDKEQKSIAAAFRIAGPTKQKSVGSSKGNAKAASSFKTLKNQTPEWSDFVSKVLGFPAWWSNQIFRRIATKSDNTVATEITHKMMTEWWDREMAKHDKHRRFFNFMKNDTSREYIIKTDLEALIRDLLVMHPGLEFLKQTPEFQDKYAETVNVRIFYTCNRSGRGHLTFNEYRRSSLHDTMLLLDQETDINNVTEYFSYEHFYVLYCKFWELDADHDFLISKEDLMKYNNYSLTESIVDVIFKDFSFKFLLSGVPRRLSSNTPGKMNYEDFIWFCLSEEDKTTETSMEYWFRCIDLDSDGILSGYELDYFYAEQRKRMENLLSEQISYEDILCQMIDMINPADPKALRLSDIKRCPTSGVFFNVLFNLNKFIAFEQRDPFQAHAEKMGPEKTEWDRFARLEYDRMAQEAEQGEEMSEPSGMEMSGPNGA